MGKQVLGVCRICDYYGRLTREHFPPKGAFNRDSFKVQGINEHKRVDDTLVWYETFKHGGNASYATCRQCNNLTGDWYARDYINFVNKLQPYAHPMNVGIGEIDLCDFYPLRVVKQVLCSFLVAIDPDENAELEAGCAPSVKRDDKLPPSELFTDISVAYKALPQIRSLLLDREAIGLPESVRLYMYLVAQRAGRSSSIGVIASRTTGKVAILSEWAWWPVGWALFFSGEPWEPLLDVTDWANCGYRTTFVSATLRLPSYWIEGRYPLDFRHPKSVQQGAAAQQAVLDERQAARRSP